MEIEFNIKMETRSISGYDQHIYHQSADNCIIFQRDKLVINIDSKLVENYLILKQLYHLARYLLNV